jgi:GNAT superfamily N-acetyltransferase
VSVEFELVTRLSEADIERATYVLSKVFKNDPLFLYLFPFDATRSHLMNAFFRANLEYCLEVGEVYTSYGISGCAMWLFPGCRAGLCQGHTDTRASQFQTVLDNESLNRLLAFMQHMRGCHNQVIKQPHCLLLFLGVDEEHRSHGIGTRLLQPVLKMADSKKLPCLLDTMNRDNLVFYEKQGFKVCLEGQICRYGPMAWTMVRWPEI